MDYKKYKIALNNSKEMFEYLRYGLNLSSIVDFERIEKLETFNDYIIELNNIKYSREEFNDKNLKTEILPVIEHTLEMYIMFIDFLKGGNEEYDFYNKFYTKLNESSILIENSIKNIKINLKSNS